MSLEPLVEMVTEYCADRDLVDPVEAERVCQAVLESAPYVRVVVSRRRALADWLSIVAVS
jgi:hypothetical protein